MPHSTDYKTCPFCGVMLHLDRYGNRPLVCDDHRDLPALEPLDDRYLLTDDGADAEAR